MTDNAITYGGQTASLLRFHGFNAIELEPDPQFTPVSHPAIRFREIDTIIGELAAAKDDAFREPYEYLPDYLDAIAALTPRTVILEMLRGSLAPKHQHRFDDFVASFEALGYVVQHRLIDLQPWGSSYPAKRNMVVAHRADDHVLPTWPRTPDHPVPVSGSGSFAPRLWSELIALNA